MDDKRIELLEDYDSRLNIGSYKKGQRLTVKELKESERCYAFFRYGGIDLIPKHLVRDS